MPDGKIELDPILMPGSRPACWQAKRHDHELKVIVFAIAKFGEGKLLRNVDPDLLQGLAEVQVLLH